MAAVVCPGPQALRQAEVLRASLKGSFEDFNVGSSGWSSRQTLQDIYKGILMNDLEFALDKKVEQDLWNSAFKSQIDFLRHQTKDNKGLKSSEIQAVLSLFLEAASGFYIQLLQEFCLHYNLDLPGHSKSSNFGILEDGNADNLGKRPHTQSCYYVCQDCLVHLGDIARYCEDANQAALFYKHALVLVPSNGQPYNQLAILASARGDQLGTVYFYCRSIVVKNQFPAASTNLHKIFSKICSRHSTSSSTDAVSKTEFCQQFLQFHGHIYTDQDLSEARQLKDKIAEGFKLLVQQDALNQDEYMQLVAITLFSLYHIKSGGVDDLEEFDCISKEDEDGWQLALEFAVHMFNALLTQVTDHTNSHSLPNHALVYIGVFCQWIAGNSTNVWREETMKSSVAWGKFAEFLNQLSSSSENIQLDMPDTALYEDWELHAFLPLVSYQKKLNFTMKNIQVKNEDAHRIYRLVQFGNKLSSHSPRILSKVEDVATGLAKFSLRTESNTSDNHFSLQELAAKPPGEVDLDTAGQKLPSLPTPAFLPQKASSPTPFAETSSLFNNTRQGAIGGSVHQPPLSAPQVPQYSLFQSGWKAPLTSAFGTTGSSSPIPPEKPMITERVLLPEQTPVGHKFVNQGPLAGTIGPLPGTIGPLPGTIGLLPGTIGEYQPISSAIPPYAGPSRPQGYSTPSPGPLDGFGLSENWGSGVWGPVKMGAPNNNPAPTQQIQSMWSQEFSPSHGMSPLQQLLHDQQKRQDNGT